MNPTAELEIRVAEFAKQLSYLDGDKRTAFVSGVEFAMEMLRAAVLDLQNFPAPERTGNDVQQL